MGREFLIGGLRETPPLPPALRVALQSELAGRLASSSILQRVRPLPFILLVSKGGMEVPQCPLVHHAGVVCSCLPRWAAERVGRAELQPLHLTPLAFRDYWAFVEGDAWVVGGL